MLLLLVRAASFVNAALQTLILMLHATYKKSMYPTFE